MFYGWQRNKKNICELIPQKTGLKVQVDIPFNLLNSEEALKFEDVSLKGRWGTGTSQCFIRNETDFEWFLPLIKKVYDSSSK